MSDLILQLDAELTETLLRLLSVAKHLSEGERVDAYFPKQPWGNLTRFTEFVYDPIVQGRPSTLVKAGDPQVITLQLVAAELPSVKKTLEFLDQSLSGGVPWARLSDGDRQVLDQVTNRLSIGRSG